MTAADLHHWMLIGFVATSVLVFLTLQFGTKAAYGRHQGSETAWWWGPKIPTRLGWVVMEAPSSLTFAIFFFMGDRATEVAPLLLFALWQLHYFHRSFIYPFQRKLKPGDTMPLLVPLTGAATNIGISFINASILTWASIRADYDLSWLSDPRFISGLALFLLGYHINRKADAMLAALRKPGETGYKIPRGWLYEKISCPNYFGEYVIWIGWALATWSWAGVVFVLWTLANLMPRALANHAWYHEKFEDYPQARKAVIPGII